MRNFDEFDFIRLAPVLDQHPDRRVSIERQDGFALMGFVPHTETAPPLRYVLQDRWLNPYARECHG